MTVVLNMPKKNVIILGTGTAAAVAAQMFDEGTSHTVAGFAVDESYKTSDIHLSKPLYSLEYVLKSFSAQQYEIFIAIGYRNLNDIRKEKCEIVWRHGFNSPSLIHPNVHLPLDFVYGQNCLIMSGACIHPCVEIGDNNFIWGGATLSHHVRVESDCWFTAGSTVAGNTQIGSGNFLGASSIIINDLTIGDNCFVGAGALVSKSLGSQSVVLREGDPLHRLDSRQFLSLIQNRF